MNNQEININEIKSLLEAYQPIQNREQTIGSIFNKSYDENFISNWLAYLLNPDNNYGDTIVLQYFMKLLDKQYYISFPDVSIEREYTFSNGEGRIDLLVTIDSDVWGIENKIWSSLGPNQISRYKDGLQSDFKSQNLCVLYPERNSNVHNEIEQNKEKSCIALTYEELTKCFKIIPKDSFTDKRFTFLFDEFINHMEAYILKSDEISDEQLNMYKFLSENAEKIEKLNCERRKSVYSFKSQIEDKVQEFIDNMADSENWEKRCDSQGLWYQLYKKEWYDKCRIHFEIGCWNDHCGACVPPKAMCVVLHTGEGELRYKKDSDLYKLEDIVKKDIKQNYPNDSLAIDYGSQESFNASLDKVFMILDYIVKKYTVKIDEELKTITH